MNKLLTIVFASLFIFFSCGQSGKDSVKDANASNNSKIEFESTTFNFGKIALGSDGTCEFKFTNTSDEALIINSVKTSCGCTNPKWPKDPLKMAKPGK